MLYVLFLVIAIAYNLKKFRKERAAFLSSLVEAKNASHREMILGHHFYVFIFEGFLAFIVAHLTTERAMAIGIVGLGAVYLFLVFAGFYLYQFFIRYVERHTGLDLYESFKGHLIKELRVNFAMVMLPILVYAVLNWAFQDEVYQEWGSLWFLGLLLNIIFISVLTIFCTVVIMLRLIPNREITEPEYLEVIGRRLAQVGQPNMRIRWIETDVKNAFVVGLKLLSFSNQTMFIGRALRTTLTLSEFDAVIAHELAHVANRHIHKRVIDLMKNFISIIVGLGIIMLAVFGGAFLYWGEDAYLHAGLTTAWVVSLCLGWFVFNYSLLFDTLRSHEFEADAYAVMVLGADLEAFKSALAKLTTQEELPEYLAQKTRRSGEKGPVTRWLARTFSTHPELAARIAFLEHKIAENLSFNYYVSTPQKIKRWFGHLLDRRIAAPLAVLLAAVLVWAGWTLKTGTEAIAFVNEAMPEEIIGNAAIARRINERPQLVGPTLMYYVVRKRDERLIDHYVAAGAYKGKTLMYVAGLRDYDLLEKYYSRFQADLSDDDYFLVLRKTAQLNFTEGYRLLVNAQRFEILDPSYKETVSRLYQSGRTRAPASVPAKR
jgi:Zn-dependent protease with chaperone function